MDGPKAEFARLSNRRQIATLARVAERALGEYGLSGSRLTKINHGFNTTFRVDATDGRKLAIRVNVNSKGWPGKLAAETAWIEALATETSLSVPRPVRTLDGRLHTEGAWEGTDWELPVALYTWLPGTLLGLGAPPERYGRLGEAVAVLHEHGSHWRPPSGAVLQTFEDPLLGDPWRLPEEGVFRETHARADEALGRLKRLATQPIHYDVHPWNVMSNRGRLSVFDFDDALFGWPELDVSVSAYYLRRADQGAEPEQAFLRGVGFERMRLSGEDYEALIAGRALLLANDLLGAVTQELRAEQEQYLEVTRKRLEHYLRTGVFDSHVAKM
jgi:Ser/Thr protein kinase RdoA (MazF antagonist)